MCVCLSTDVVPFLMFVTFVVGMCVGWYLCWFESWCLRLFNCWSLLWLECVRMDVDVVSFPMLATFVADIFECWSHLLFQYWSLLWLMCVSSNGDVISFPVCATFVVDMYVFWCLVICCLFLWFIIRELWDWSFYSHPAIFATAQFLSFNGPSQDKISNCIMHDYSSQWPCCRPFDRKSENSRFVFGGNV